MADRQLAQDGVVDALLQRVVAAAAYLHRQQCTVSPASTPTP